MGFLRLLAIFGSLATCVIILFHVFYPEGTANLQIAAIVAAFILWACLRRLLANRRRKRLTAESSPE